MTRAEIGRVLVAAAVALLALSCVGPRTASAPAATPLPTDQQIAQAPEAAPGDLADAEEDTEVASEMEPPDASAFPGCAGHLDDGAPREVQVAGRKATIQGYRLTFHDVEPGGRLVLGVLGPLNEDSGLNLLALRGYLQFFAQEKVDAVVVTGDSGEYAEGIARALEAVAAAKVPVLVVSGNRECKDDFFEGVAAAQQQSDAIVNLNVVRAVELGGLTLVSLPGYHDPNYITCETGCRYDAATLDDVVKIARAAKGPVLLVSHGPPLGRSSQSIDYANNAANAGDPQINRVLKEGRIAFGVFSNIKEAGARATESDGVTLVPQGQMAKGLWLNPGPADTTSWEMNDKSRAYGFAATLAFQDGKASWKLFRGTKPTADDKKAARELERKATAPDGKQGAP